MSSVDPAAIGAEIESLIERLREAGDAHTAAQARELVRHLMNLYGAGFARALDIVRTEHGGAPAVLDRFAADPLLASLLVLHDLHPHPIRVRVERALEALSPHLPQGTRLTLAEAAGDAVRVKVDRPASAPGQSTGGIRLAIERAIQEAAPEVGTIDIDGLDTVLIQVIRPARAAGSADQRHD